MTIDLKLDLSTMTEEEKLKLGFSLKDGTGGYIRNYAAAREVFESLGENAAALNELGLFYRDGNGVETDNEKAKAYFLRAADKGLATAMVNLGNIGEEEEDYELAYQWYRKAFILGDVKGKFNYANLFHHGWFVEQDYGYAFRLFRELVVEDGFTDALFYCGHYFQNGYGVEKDEKMAFRLFEMGEKNGDAYCTTELGRCYALGIGTEKDEDKALRLYLKAGELGDPLGYANAAYCYEVGQGCKKNLPNAEMFYQRGANAGEEHCIEALQRLRDPNKSDDEIFLKHIAEIDPEGVGQIKSLMAFARAQGLKTDYNGGPLGVFITPVFNIAPRNRAKGEYIRLEHKISKLAVKNRMSERRVVELFQPLVERAGEKNGSIVRGYVYLDACVLHDPKIFLAYLQILFAIAKTHLPPKSRMVAPEEFLGLPPQPVIVPDHRELEEAVHAFCEQKSQRTFEAAVDALKADLETEAYIPLTAQDDALKPMVIRSDDGKYWLPVFTSEEEAYKGEKAALGSVVLEACLRSVFGFDKEVGVVINPYGERFALTRSQVAEVLAEA